MATWTLSRPMWRSDRSQRGSPGCFPDWPHLMPVAREPAPPSTGSHDRRSCAHQRTYAGHRLVVLPRAYSTSCAALRDTEGSD